MKLKDKADAFDALDEILHTLKPKYDALNGSEYYKFVEYKAEDIKRLIDLCEGAI